MTKKEPETGVMSSAGSLKKDAVSLLIFAIWMFVIAAYIFYQNMTAIVFVDNKAYIDAEVTFYAILGLGPAFIGFIGLCINKFVSAHNSRVKTEYTVDRKITVTPHGTIKFYQIVEEEEKEE